MSNAVMPLAHYKETCDAIRQKTDSTNVIKSGDLPQEIEKVFNAGQLSVISQSEALKGSAQGEGVTIKDISSVEHNVPCKVKSKNLLNAMEIANYIAATDYVKDTENNSFTLRGAEGGQYLAGSGQLSLPNVNSNTIIEKGVKVKGGVKYTLSFDLLVMEQGAYNSNISVVIYTSDLGTIPAGIVEGTLGSTVRRSITFTPTTDESISVCFRINNNYVTLSNIQVEEGSIATEFASYIDDLSSVTVNVGETGKSVSANNEGIVEGIKSIYPSMTLTSDTEGVIITAEYIKDIDKAFEERLAEIEKALVNN